MLLQQLPVRPVQRRRGLGGLGAHKVPVVQVLLPLRMDSHGGAHLGAQVRSHICGAEFGGSCAPAPRSTAAGRALRHGREAKGRLPIAPAARKPWPWNGIGPRLLAGGRRTHTLRAPPAQVRSKRAAGGQPVPCPPSLGTRRDYAADAFADHVGEVADFCGGISDPSERTACAGGQIAMRISFANFCFFALLALITVALTRPDDPRVEVRGCVAWGGDALRLRPTGRWCPPSLPRAGHACAQVHVAMWALKLLVWAGALVGFFWVPTSAINGYAQVGSHWESVLGGGGAPVLLLLLLAHVEALPDAAPRFLHPSCAQFARAGSGIFLVLQLVLLIDFVYRINEWLTEQDTRPAWAVLILGAGCAFALGYVALGFAFHWYTAR